MVLIKLIIVQGSIRTYAFERSVSLSELLAKAEEVNPTDYLEGSPSRNDSRINSNTMLYNKDEVILAKAITGNSDNPFAVELIIMQGRTDMLAAQDGDTIGTLINNIKDPEARSEYLTDSGKAAWEFRDEEGDALEGGIDHVVERPSDGKPVLIMCGKKTKANEKL